MIKIKQIYSWLINTGLDKSDTSLLARQVRATNFVILVGVFLQMPLVVFNFSNDVLEDRIVVAVYSAFCLFYLWLNYKKRYDLSRISFLTITVLVISWLADIQDRPSGVAINLLIPFMITFLIFSFKERFKIILMVLFIGICFAALELTDYEVTGINRFKTPENAKIDYLYNAAVTFLVLVFGLLYYSYQFFITEKNMQNSLDKTKLSEEITNAVIEANNDLIWVIDDNYKVIKYNKLFKTSFKDFYKVDIFPGYDMIGDYSKIQSKYNPNWKLQQKKWISFYNRCLAGENFVECEEIEMLGNKVYLKNSLYNITAVNNKNYAAIFSEDITQEVLHDKKQKQSLLEKELLLKEIHHRVKNNMQIIIGLLQLQELYTNKEEFTPIFNDINGRIKAMSLVHELLYQSDDLSYINFNIYIQKLAHHIANSYKETASKITFVFEQDPYFLTIEKAIPLGMLLNELLTNALKYAFTNLSSGKIELGVKEDNNKFIFYFKDNGVGLPESMAFEEEEAATLGLTLIYSLANQIDSKLKTVINNGTAYYLELNSKN